MKLLSENETALLIGDLSKIQLPAEVELYISLGIPQIFKRITNSVQSSIDRNWLYFPISLLENFKQKSTNVPLKPTISVNDLESISCDSFYLFPVNTEKKINIILVSKKKNLDNLNEETLHCLLKTFDVYKSNKQKFSESHDLFLQNLAENNESIHGFMKSIINLIVKNIPKSCAGFYTDEQNCLKRRMIVGDINKFSLLTSSVSDKEKADWNFLINTNSFFMPMETLRNEIQFLANPPDFKFVCKGLFSNCSENFISVIIPGNSDLSLVQFLDTIASMTSKFSESNFMKSSSIIEFYKNNMPNYKKNISSFVLGEKLFLLLNKQLRVTRLLFMHDKTSIVISFSKDNVYLSKEIDSLTFKDSLLDDFQGLEYIMKSSPITYFQNNNVYMDNSKVNSELLYKIINSDGNHTFISVGIPKKIEVLKLYLPFIQDALEAYVDCRDAQYTHSAYEKTLMSEKILKSRTQLTGKLTTGYFYQLSSKMTVLLGKTEQIKEMISKIKNDSEMKTLIKHVEAIEKNADYIGSSVTALQALIPNENLNYDRKVNASELMSKIPGYLGGYLQQISIRRNLSIRIDNVTLGKSEFLISRAEIDDILIPILLSLLDNADKDGTLAISAYSEVNTEYIKITFHNDLIANKEIINIILKPFQKYKISADESGNLTFGNHFISYFTSKDEMVSIRIHLKDFKTFDGTHIQNIKEVTTSV